MNRTSLLLLLALGLWAQDHVLRPPILGRLVDSSSNVIVTVAGVPGGARALPPVAIEGFTGTAVAPLGNFALGSADGHVAVVKNLDGEPQLAAIDGAAGTATLAGFTGSGSAAAVYSSECGCVRVISGLPDNPTVERTEATQPPVAIALSADRATVAIATDEVVTVLRSEQPTQSLPLSGVTALAFGPSQQLAAARSKSREVWIASSGELALVLSERDGLENPVGAAFDRAGRLLAVDRAGIVWLVDSAAGSVTKTDCGCAPEVLQPVNAGSVLLLTPPRSSGPLWMLDLSDAGPRLFFVPVERLSEGAR